MHSLSALQFRVPSKTLEFGPCSSSTVLIGINQSCRYCDADDYRIHMQQMQHISAEACLQQASCSCGIRSLWVTILGALLDRCVATGMGTWGTV